MNEFMAVSIKTRTADYGLRTGYKIRTIKCMVNKGTSSSSSSSSS